MHKIIAFLVCIIFVSSLNAQQKIYIKDSLTRESLKDIQVIVNDEVYYTNDDGAVLLPKNETEILFSNSTYKTKKIKTLKDTILLQPIYKEIEEVVIRKKVDLIAIINQTLYTENKNNYYLNESNFLLNFKQKGTLDNKIHNILIGDLNLWTKNTVYDYNLKPKSYDDFINMNVNEIKYNRNSNSLFNAIQLYPQDFVYNLFINIKLSNILEDVRNNNATVNSKIIFEDKDFQKVGFDYETKVGFANGYILYSKSDKIITSLELNHIFKNSNITQKVNKNGVKYNTVTNQSTVKFDEYKKNGKYYPARVLIKGIGKNIIDNEEHHFTFEQSVIYNQQKNSTKKGLKNKIDLSKPLTENIPTKEVATTKTLLSAEEQKFVDEP